jgi:hypothetical protein
MRQWHSLSVFICLSHSTLYETTKQEWLFAEMFPDFRNSQDVSKQNHYLKVDNLITYESLTFFNAKKSVLDMHSETEFCSCGFTNSLIL